MKTTPLSEVEGLVGQEIGVSDWMEIDQDRINAFADVTDDHQFIHVNPELAAHTPFGTTIAHGFLTVSLIAKFAEGTVLRLEGVKMGLNYGFDKLRMMTPVKCGQRIRGRFVLMSAKERLAGQWVFKYSVRIEIEGEAKPALAAEWIMMQFV